MTGYDWMDTVMGVFLLVVLFLGIVALGWVLLGVITGYIPTR